MNPRWRYLGFLRSMALRSRAIKNLHKQRKYCEKTRNAYSALEDQLTLAESDVRRAVEDVQAQVRSAEGYANNPQEYRRWREAYEKRCK